MNSSSYPSAKRKSEKSLVPRLVLDLILATRPLENLLNISLP